MTLIRGEFPEFGIAVAGYPETHQEAPSAEVDLVNLKRKVDAGADIVITQLFYDNADFHRFRDRCSKLDICVPIIPGVLPVTNLAQIRRITGMCGARLPTEFVSQLEVAMPILRGNSRSALISPLLRCRRCWTLACQASTSMC